MYSLKKEKGESEDFEEEEVEDEKWSGSKGDRQREKPTSKDKK